MFADSALTGRMEDGTEPGATRWLNATELDARKPFSGMLLVPLSALDAQLQRDAKSTLFGYLVMAGLSEIAVEDHRLDAV